MGKAGSFSAWLAGLTKQFCELTDEERNIVLDHLIDISSAAQLYHLSKRLDTFLKRDFLKLLPWEIGHHLLSYLDPQTLAVCCCVCKEWNQIVSSCTSVWKQACFSIGAIENKRGEEAKPFKKLYTSIARRIEDLQSGQAFEMVELAAHSSRVMALYYRDGLLATGSDDHTVRLWNCDTGRCIQVLETHTVADVKFNSHWVFTASFDTTAARWDMHTGHLLTQYTGHVAAVFSIDYDEELDLIVTGSADSLVKLWSLTKGEQLKTLTMQSAGWITQVKIYRTNCSDYYYVLCRDNSALCTWLMDRNHDIRHQDEKQVTLDYLVPGMQVDNEKIVFCTYEAESHTCSVVQLPLPSIPAHGSDEIKQETYSKTVFCNVAPVQALIGHGEHFSILLVSTTPVSLAVMNNNSGRLVASISLPDIRSSKRGSTYTLGNKKWLSGFDGHNDTGLFFGASLRNDDILLLKWTDK